MNIEFSKIEKKRKIEIAKNSLIKEKVKQIEILKFRKDTKINDEFFEQIVKNYFFKFNFKNIQEFEVFFKNKGLNTRFVKNKIIIDTLWKQLIFEKFSKSIKIDRNKIELSVKNNNKQKEYLLSEIVFNLGENENLNNKIKIITDLIKEKNFSEAALNFSISDTYKEGGN